MTAALLIVHQGEDGMVTPMPFVYRSGEMMSIVEEVADYIAGMELVDSLWEGIAADRLRIILEQRVQLQEAAQAVKEAREMAEMFTVREAVGRCTRGGARGRSSRAAFSRLPCSSRGRIGVRYEAVLRGHEGGNRHL